MAEKKHPPAQQAVSERVAQIVEENRKASALEPSQSLYEHNAEAIWRGDKGYSRRLLRRPEVEARTGLSRSTLYEWMKRGEFPQPVKLGARLVAWRESDINAWLESRETRGSA